MDPLHALILAVLQGLTEFLPISSSAHLILLPVWLGWPDQGLTFDVAVHFGSLIAVVLYFRTDIRQLVTAWVANVTSGQRSDQSHLAWALIVATLPVLVFGFVINGWFADALRDPRLIAATTLVFGLLLWWADRTGGRSGDEHELTLKQAAMVGFAQAIALIPGTSRSGITITAGLALGLSRRAAARFSFLLAIPVILLAGIVKLTELAQQPEPASWPVVLFAIVASAVMAYLCIRYFLALVERIGLMPFVVYRVILALLLFYSFA